MKLNYIKLFIANGDTEKALNELLKLSNGEDNDLFSRSTALKARHVQLERKKREGTISNEEEIRQKANIDISAIGLVDDFDKIFKDEEEINSNYHLVKKSNLIPYFLGLGALILLLNYGISSWILKNNSSFNLTELERQKVVDDLKDLGALPIGTIIPWHNNILAENTELDEIKLPIGWVRCGGQTVIVKKGDKDYPVNLPDLNGSRLFLRGDATSGKEEQEDFKSFSVFSSKSTYQHNETNIPKDGNHNEIPIFGGKYDATNENGLNVGNGLKFRFDKTSEIRPKNMSVVYIIKIK